MSNIEENARPFYFEGKGENKKTLILLIHGFTGSPAHLLELGKALNSEGYSVKGPLLSGHGTTAEDMEFTNWKDWLSSAVNAYEEEVGKFEKINVGGISMGGLLTLILGSRYPEINKIFTMNTPIRFKNKIVHITPIIKYFKRFNEIVPPDVAEGENADLDIGLSKTPVRCIPSLVKISKMAEKGLSKIKTDIFIIQSKIDGQVNPVSADIINDKVSTDNKRILWLEKSKHLCTLGLEREFITKEIIKYLSE